MVPSEIRNRIRESLAPPLLDHGFRGRSSTFSREVNDVFHLIQLQPADDNSPAGARFTVNVAVWVPKLASTQTPSVADAHWSIRLGELDPENTERWWQADDFDMADDAARDMVLRIQAHAIPALDKLRSTRDLLALWKTGSSPGLTRLQADRFRQKLEPRRG